MEWGRTMGIVEGLDILDGGLLARVHQCDVALTAHRQQAVAHGQAHHLLAVFQPNLRRSPSGSTNGRWIHSWRSTVLGGFSNVTLMPPNISRKDRLHHNHARVTSTITTNDRRLSPLLLCRSLVTPCKQLV